MNSVKYVVKSVGPKLVPFLKTVAIYFVIFPSPDKPTIFSTILKCLPIISLMLFVVLHGMSFEERFKYPRRILIGLTFCCLGDAFLVWPNYFIAGMIAFAIGHVNYILAFGFEPLSIHLGVAVLALDIAATVYLLPDIEGVILTIGVPIYIIVIGAMLWRALALLNSTKDLNWKKICSSIGAILFVISDFMIAINMFKFRMDYGQALVMSSYYAAQLLIALSVVDSSQSHS